MSKGYNKTLTEKQQSILDFVKNFITRKGYPPTYGEISNHFEITKKGAYDHILAIQKKGYIQVEENKARAMRVIESGKEKIEELGFFLRKNKGSYVVVFIDGYRRPATGPEIKLWEMLGGGNER